MKYYDFDVWIGGQTGDHYETRARSESMGENQGRLLPAALDQTYAAAEKLSSGDVDDAFLKQVGGSLFTALFDGAIGVLYHQALGQVYADDSAGVRIRLRIEPPELAALPWELLYDSGRDCFLATSTETLLTRYIELPKPIRELQTSLPIRILAIIPGGSGLDTTQEMRTIQDAVTGLQNTLEIKVLEGKVTSDDISRQLVDHQFHIIHFIGHGGFLKEKGCLVLNSEQGDEPDLISAKEFSYFFQNYPCMKLVVLNSCSGAQSSTRSLTGVAQELVAMGIPAVVAMRKKITDEGAKLFAENFYLNLCRGNEQGRVDIAV
ncbi:MAG TPA: CHAT domain-containing protein, partial [Pyrinomonadaceae bacterium]|nr:CHAT domain-containing protein [Pyrinomonadaceae bacterium]